MIGQLESAVRLATGRWTPFLLPSASAPEHEASSDAVEQFEAALSRRLRDRRIIATGSGYEALVLALSTLPAGEVIIPSFVCAAVGRAVVDAGHRPVMGDVGSDLNLSLAGFREALDIAQNPRAVVVPHLCGTTNNDIRQIEAEARAHGLLVIEDAAQALGLSIDGTPAGSVCDLAIVSTGLGKPIFAPAGGALVIRPGHPIETAISPPTTPLVDQYVVQSWNVMRAQPAAQGRQRLAMRFGVRRNDTIPDAEASELHTCTSRIAAIALCELDRLDDLVSNMRANAATWVDLLDRTHLLDRIGHCPLADSNGLKFWIDMPAEDVSTFRESLWRAGIETESLYTPLHMRDEFRTARHASLENTERLWPRVFCLPTRPNLDRRDWARARHALERAARTLRGSPSGARP